MYDMMIFVRIVKALPHWHATKIIINFERKSTIHWHRQKLTARQLDSCSKIGFRDTERKYGARHRDCRSGPRQTFALPRQRNTGIEYRKWYMGIDKLYLLIAIYP